MPVSVELLTRCIDNEVIRAMGVPLDGWLAARLHAVLRRATSRFSELFAEVDRIVDEQGLPAGALWLLRRLASGLETRGTQNIPPEGPLIIASNHPGAVDSLVLAASAQRRDLKIIAGAVPFLENLPHVRDHLIFAPENMDIQARMLSVRESIRHLRQGGALLLFAHGSIDPDPAFMPREHELNAWSRSLEIFVRTVPDLQVVISIVSGVIDPGFMHHPLTWLRRARPDRQRLAMMIQIIEQMLGRKLELTPHVTFGPLLDLQHIGDAERSLPAIVRNAEQLMEAHVLWQS